MFYSTGTRVLMIFREGRARDAAGLYLSFFYFFFLLFPFAETPAGKVRPNWPESARMKRERETIFTFFIFILFFFICIFVLL